MAEVGEGKWSGWLRRQVLGGQRLVAAEDFAQLQREVAAVRAQLVDRAEIGKAVVEALRAELRAHPGELAAALRPAVEDCLRRREASRQLQRPQRRVRRWFSSGTLLLAAAVALIARAPLGSGTIGAADAGGLALVASGPAMIAEERRGFGLGEAAISDEAIADLVRERLAGCATLEGARVRVAVTDGWVWLRGAVNAEARGVVDAALDGLGEGVFVVNQLVVARDLPDG
jgi:hypothetical protein